MLMRTLELLSPAKNLECGKAAIEHGADAVYIGASRFGARAAVGNSIDDIRELCAYAHQFEAKVYVTVNTIIYDNELDDSRQLLEQLADCKVDAILVQDMAILSLIPQSLTLHASTQTDNRSADKVKWLHSLGFKRVVLARELSLEEIQTIHEAVPDVELEVFVHGALCVSYSGVCYASQHCFGRSANRGECAQFCRMPFDLIDADGRVVEKNRHLLSLKDMNRLDYLEELAEAGACSFKIEGRLKDVSYVKNVTAAYNERLNQIVRRHPDKYCRASRGRTTYTFKPDLNKTFNRSYTTYFLHGRTPDIASFDTPKAMGEFVGTVKELRGHSFNVAGTASFTNGDGLCFVDDNRQLQGFRVNRVEGNRLFPLSMPKSLRPGTRLYRNSDQEFERLLSKSSAERKIPITMTLQRTADGYALTVDGRVTSTLDAPHQQAQKPQRENIIRQLTKLGGTPYSCDTVELPTDFNDFIPSSLLADLRRRAIEQLQQAGRSLRPRGPLAPTERTACSDLSHVQASYQQNIANHLARTFYESQGLNHPVPAFELSEPDGALLMQCRHCLRYALGYCVKNGGRPPQWHEPLHLRLGDGRTFRLEFDCRHCQMNVYAESR